MNALQTITCDNCGAPDATEHDYCYVCADCADELCKCDRCNVEDLHQFMRNGLCDNCADDMWCRR